MTAAVALAAVLSLALGAAALRARAVLPGLVALAGVGALAVSDGRQPLVVLAADVIGVLLLVLGRLVWRLLDDG